MKPAAALEVKELETAADLELKESIFGELKGLNSAEEQELEELIHPPCSSVPSQSAEDLVINRASAQPDVRNDNIHYRHWYLTFSPE